MTPRRPPRSWPPAPSGRVPLVSTRVGVNLALLAAGVCGIGWYSFAPAPDYLLLVAILVVGWILLWVIGNLATVAHDQTWQPYRPLAGRRRGRDSRVSQLRALIQEQDRPGSADGLHAVVAAVTRERLAARGLDPVGDREDVLALLGADLRAYLEAPPGARTRAPRDLDQYLARVERI